MSVTTRQQKMAEAAFTAVSANPRNREYRSFAKSFPALIQTAGLCQAVAFAQAKGKGSGAQSQKVLEAIRTTLNAGSTQLFATADELANRTRQAPVTDYLRLMHVSLQAATWVKRYVEALEATSPSSAVAEPDAEYR